MNKLNLLIRILSIIAPFFFPWWAVLVLVLATLSLYDNYYEIIIIGLICDVLYDSSQTFFGLYAFTIIGCLLFIIGQQIKKRLIMY
jgi:hypothetical protein